MSARVARAIRMHSDTVIIPPKPSLAGDRYPS